MNKDEVQEQINRFKTTNTGKFKSLLFDNNLKLVMCEECKVTDTYNSKPITLQLHHIDGNNQNNHIDNFQILCPNCHSQTKTFRAPKRVTDDQILAAANNSKTISEIIKKLGKYASGGIYKRIEKVILEHKLPITKYDYTSNRAIGFKKPRGRKPTGLTLKTHICKHCNLEFKHTHKRTYCSSKCTHDAACKYNIDVQSAIPLIKKFGWSQAAVKLNINTKCPDVTLRLAVKRHIKYIDPTLDLHELSKFSHHSRYIYDKETRQRIDKSLSS